MSPGSSPLFTDSHTELTINWPCPLFIISRHKPHRKHSSSIVAIESVAAGTCLLSRCPETALVYPSISQSLHSNGSARYNIVTDLINALLGNSLPTHAPSNDGGTCLFYEMTYATIEDAVFSVATSPTIETVFSMGSMQIAYMRSEFTSQLNSGQLRVVVDQK
jgi:hypothetical protein